MGRNNIKIKKIEMMSYKILIYGKKLQEVINQGIIFLESIKELLLGSNLSILKDIIKGYNDTINDIIDVVGNEEIFYAFDYYTENDIKKAGFEDHDRFVDFEWLLQLSTHDRELIKTINYFSSQDDRTNNEEKITQDSRVSDIIFTLYELQIGLINFVSKARNLIGID